MISDNELQQALSNGECHLAIRKHDHKADPPVDLLTLTGMWSGGASGPFCHVLTWLSSVPLPSALPS